MNNQKTNTNTGDLSALPAVPCSARLIDWACCGNCGSGSVELTTNAPEGMAHEDDELRCLECGERGQVFFDADGYTVDLWNGKDLL